MREFNDIEIRQIALICSQALKQQGMNVIDQINDQLRDEKFKILLVDSSDTPLQVQAKVQETKSEITPIGHTGFRH